MLLQLCMYGSNRVKHQSCHRSSSHDLDHFHCSEALGNTKPESCVLGIKQREGTRATDPAPSKEMMEGSPVTSGPLQCQIEQQEDNERIYENVWVDSDCESDQACNSNENMDLPGKKGNPISNRSALSEGLRLKKSTQNIVEDKSIRREMLTTELKTEKVDLRQALLRERKVNGWTPAGCDRRATARGKIKKKDYAAM